MPPGTQDADWNGSHQDRQSNRTTPFRSDLSDLSDLSGQSGRSLFQSLLSQGTDWDGVTTVRVLPATKGGGFNPF